MKRKTIIGACVLLGAGSTYLVLGAAGAEPAQTQGKDISIAGRLSCTFCALAHSDKPCTPEGCAACVKAGAPAALTDAQGSTYILLTGEKGTPLMTPARLQMMGGPVTVKGLLVKRNGLQVIYVNAMQKADAKPITVTGRLSCTFCTLAHPDKACSPECCTACVKAGDPPLLTDAQGEIYLLLSGEKETRLMTPARLQMVGGQVTVKGLLVHRNGIRAIHVDSIQK